MKEVVEYLCDSFIDFKGAEHKFILCALSRVDENVEVFFHDEDGFAPSARTLTIGYSVCNTVDEFDEELGKKIAYNRAKSNKMMPDIVATIPGIINTKVVLALLEQEAEYIKRDPNSIIPGYNEKVKKYREEKDALDFYNNMTDEEKIVVNLLKYGGSLEMYERVAKYLPDTDC